MSIYILTSDGGSRSNPGPAASGFAIYEVNQEITDPEKLLEMSLSVDPAITGGKYLGVATNNQAEWLGVILGLKEILDKFGGENTHVQAFLDSELVIRQISGQYKVKHPDLIPLHKELKALLPKFETVSFTHIFRKFNKVADGVVNQILDENR